jgi:hypothetical protein
VRSPPSARRILTTDYRQPPDGDCGRLAKQHLEFL